MDPSAIIYNPTAGGGRHSAEEVIAHFTGMGMEVTLSSTDDPQWADALKKPLQSLIVAGGDGTVHKVALEILDRDLHLPMAVHPLGTANNIAKVLGTLRGDTPRKSLESIPFDVGKISSSRVKGYFIESMGLGVFPKFIKAIKKEKDRDSIKRDNVQLLRKFTDIVSHYKPRKTTISVEGIKIKGEFLLVELLNINFLGPNLDLSPKSVPSDGSFELCLVPGQRKEEFKEFLAHALLKGPGPSEMGPCFLRIPFKKIKLKSKDPHFHIDDGILDNPWKRIKVGLLQGRLNFIQS